MVTYRQKMKVSTIKRLTLPNFLLDPRAEIAAFHTQASEMMVV